MLLLLLQLEEDLPQNDSKPIHSGDYELGALTDYSHHSHEHKDIRVIKVEGELAIDGCTGDVSSACALPAAKVGEAYSYTLSFSIGDPTVPVVWTITGNLPPGLTLAADGTISGTPLPPPGTYTFVVTATRGSLKVSRQVRIVVS